MNPMFQAAVTPLIRAVGLVATGWLVSHGLWSESFAGKVLESAVVAVAAWLWALWEKYKDRILLHTALALPAGSTANEAKAVVQAGNAPPASVPETTVPMLKQDFRREPP